MTFRASSEARDWVRTTRRDRAYVLCNLLALREGDEFAAQELARLIPADARAHRRLQAATDASEHRLFTVRDGIARSGYRSVHSVSIACLVLDALGETAPQRPNVDFWLRAAERGVLAILAGHAHRAHVDVAFAAGFLADVGILMLAMFERLERGTSGDEVGLEVHAAAARRGGPGAELGAVLAEHWGLPPELAEAMGGPPADGPGVSIREVMASAERAAAWTRGGDRPAAGSVDETLLHMLEAQGGQPWLAGRSRRFVELAFVDDGVTDAA